MKKIYILASSLLLSYSTINAQVDLPYTLNFNSSASISGDIVRDGQGGTADINGLNIEIFPTSTTDFNTPLPGFSMVWKDNSYWSSGDATLNGVGPDYDVIGTGVPALIIKSDNVANRFSLQSIQAYDWGGTTPWTISTYRNGSFVGSVTLSFVQTNWPPATASQSDILTPAYFQDIDEIRIEGPAGTNIYPVVNKIALATSTALPVPLFDFSGSILNNQIELQWQSGEEGTLSRYEIQQSEDANSFTTVAISNAEGSGKRYKKAIPYTSSGTYFRLKMIDKDNSVSFSKVINIKNSGETALSVFPVPATGTISLNTTEAGEGVITDATGRQLKAVSLHKGINQVDISALASGLYYFLQNGQKIKFIKK